MVWPPSLLVRLLLLTLLAAVGMWETRLSLVAVFLSLVALVSRAVNTTSSAHKARVWLLIGASLLFSTIGFFRFVMVEAIPGVIAGGRAAAEKHAVAYLRTIVAAQDYMRRSGSIDFDRDGVGAAGSLEELTGQRALRSNGSLEQHPMYITPDQWLPNSAFVASGAYLYRVCLPAKGSGWLDPVGAAWSERVDEERAEREYLVYGWPKTWSPGSPTAIYVSDAYEAIRVLSDSSAGAHSSRYAGESAPPPCDLLANDVGFQPWKNKTARGELPGDARL